FPAGAHPPIVYPVARVRAGTHPQAAAFLGWLGSDAATALFARHGFDPHCAPAMFSPEETTAIALSLKVAVAASLASLPPGVAVAWLLARRRFLGKGLLDALVHLPLVLPPVVVGYALLVAFGHGGPLGRLLSEYFGITLAFRWTGAALASAIMGFPLMVRAIRLSIESVDRRLERAASTLGASPLRVFFTVTLPLAWPGLVAGAVLAFAKALGEFGATITFVSSIPGQTRTLSS